MNVLSPLFLAKNKVLKAPEQSNVLYINPAFMIQNSLKETHQKIKAYRVMSNRETPNTVSTTLLDRLNKSSNEGLITEATTIAQELPPSLITALMKIAETCVIKSNRVSRDETPDFVQNCLLKLLLQVERQRVVTNASNTQYFVLRQDGSPLEIERWFGTAAANISIDRYRRLKHQVDGLEVSDDIPSNKEDSLSFVVPEPSMELEEELREQKIQEMAQYCAHALNDCMDDTWLSIAEDNYKNFTLDFTHANTGNTKGNAVANYCRVILEEKYNNDGKKIMNHDNVCQALGIIIRPENISHKKKKFEQLMLKCIANKVDIKFNASAKELLEDDSTGDR
jgi:hypothetical protein